MSPSSPSPTPVIAILPQFFSSFVAQITWECRILATSSRTPNAFLKCWNLYHSIIVNPILYYSFAWHGAQRLKHRPLYRHCWPSLSDFWWTFDEFLAVPSIPFLIWPQVWNPDGTWLFLGNWCHKTLKHWWIPGLKHCFSQLDSNPMKHKCWGKWLGSLQSRCILRPRMHKLPLICLIHQKER